MAGRERAADGGGDSGGGGILYGGLAALTAEGIGEGCFDDLGYHC